MSKRALSCASYVSKVSDSETFIVNVVEPNGEINKVLPVTIKTNLDEKDEQMEMESSPPKTLLDVLLIKVIEDMATACIAAGLTREIKY